MREAGQAYGLWGLAAANAAIFVVFAFSFFRPNTPRDWRSFGAFSAFLVALFAEMYGFPLTIYVLSGWLQSRYPAVDWFSHDVEPAFWPFPPPELRVDRRRLPPYLRRVEDPLWRAAGRPHRDRGRLRLCPPPAVRRLRAGPARVPGAVADVADPGHVPPSRGHVWPARTDGGARGVAAMRRGLFRLHAQGAGFLSNEVGASRFAGPCLPRRSLRSLRRRELRSGQGCWPGADAERGPLA
jgi:hypothetical protein